MASGDRVPCPCESLGRAERARVISCRCFPAGRPPLPLPPQHCSCGESGDPIAACRCFSAEGEVVSLAEFRRQMAEFVAENSRWFDAEDAVRYGLAHGIVEEPS